MHRASCIASYIEHQTDSWQRQQHGGAAVGTSLFARCGSRNGLGSSTGLQLQMTKGANILIKNVIQLLSRWRLSSLAVANLVIDLSFDLPDPCHGRISQVLHLRMAPLDLIVQSHNRTIIQGNMGIGWWDGKGDGSTVSFA